MTTIINLLYFLVLFGTVVFFHELGHFIIAKKVGSEVSEFAIGMGPSLISFNKNKTRYSLNIIPIGGFVKIEGLEKEIKTTDQEYSFKSLLDKIFIVISGPLMNFVAAFVIFCFVFLFVKGGNHLLSVLFISLKYIIFNINIILKTLFGIFKGDISIDNLVGPIGIAKIAGNVGRSGLFNFLIFMAQFNINLGIINLLPLPALDGGRLAFLLWELFTRKKLDKNIETIINYLGLTFLICLVVYVTLSNDLNGIF